MNVLPNRKGPKHAYYFLVLVFLTFIIGCNGHSNKSQTNPTLTFEIHDSLISNPVIDKGLGISYAYPIHWKKLPDSVLSNISNQIAHRVTQESLSPINIVSGYWDETSKSHLVISQLRSFDSTLVKKALDEYKDVFQRTYREADVHTTKFSKDEFHVYQMLGISQDLVVLREIFISNVLLSPFEFDFIIPRTYYQSKLKQIESVIGSITIHPFTN